MAASYKIANIFLVSYIFLLFRKFSKSTKHKKPIKYWSYCIRNCTITNVYPLKQNLDQSKNWKTGLIKSKKNYTGYFTCPIWLLKTKHMWFCLGLSQNLSTHSIFLHCSIYVRRTKVVLFPAERKITRCKTS